MYLYALYVCAFSLYRESPDWSWGEKPLSSEVALSQLINLICNEMFAVLDRSSFVGWSQQYDDVD
jgi:hypothetical protein